MSEEKKEKEGSFDPRCVADIYDKLSAHNYALRAFGALLQSSDLFSFADQNLADTMKSNNFEAADLRWGLSQIIDLYLAHQESILAGYVDQYSKSDICLMRRAKYLIGSMDRGGYQTKNVAIRELREAADILDTVISHDGELKEKAEELKSRCMEYLQPLTGKKAV